MDRFAAFAFVVASLAATDAQASVKFCNKFPREIYVAVAYSQDDNTWISRGWLDLQTGDCQEFDSALRPGTLYYRAESVSFRNAKGVTVTQVWGSADHRYAIDPNNNFNYWNAQEKVLKSTLADFSLAAEGLTADSTVTVTIEEDGIHATKEVSNPSAKPNP
jgi:hypothetical protein